MESVKRISILVLLISSLFVINSYKFLQTDFGPHGGKVTIAGKYYIEMKYHDDSFNAFLLDKEMLPIKNDFLSANVRFFYNDETTQEFKLQKFNEDGFCTETSVPDFVSCKITFTIYGKHVWANFENISFYVKKNKK